jgi:hypothetical protein
MRSRSEASARNGEGSKNLAIRCAEHLDGLRSIRSVYFGHWKALIEVAEPLINAKMQAMTAHRALLYVGN